MASEWKIVTDANKHPLAPDKFYRLIEKDGSSIAIAYGNSIEECDTNAKVIAASRDLLEALQVFVNKYRTAVGAELSLGKIGLVNGDFFKAEAAIKKATE